MKPLKCQYRFDKQTGRNLRGEVAHPHRTYGRGRGDSDE